MYPTVRRRGGREALAHQGGTAPWQPPHRPKPHTTEQADASRPRRRVSRERLVAAHQAAGEFYTSQLAAPAGAAPRAYLRSRGLGPLLTSPAWELGYAPASWTALTSHLRARGFTTAELLTAGLVVRARTGGVVDRFRDRLMLPVHQHDGQLVGFVGRAAPGAGSDTPKYLNSPRTPLFDKSALLYGLCQAQAALSAGAAPVIVEGPFDALAVHLASQAETGRGLVAVAPCGTAFTPAHAAALARYGGQRVLVAFDADPAGRRASARAYDVLAAHHARLEAVDLPDGCDPAALLENEGPRALREALTWTRPLADAVLDHGLRPWLPKRDNAEACATAVEALAATVAGLRPGDVARQAGRLADAFDLDPCVVTEALTDTVTEAVPSRSDRTPPNAADRASPQPRSRGSAPALLSALADHLHHPSTTPDFRSPDPDPSPGAHPMSIPIDTDPQQAFHDLYARLVDLCERSTELPEAAHLCVMEAFTTLTEVDLRLPPPGLPRIYYGPVRHVLETVRQLLTDLILTSSDLDTALAFIRVDACVEAALEQTP